MQPNLKRVSAYKPSPKSFVSTAPICPRCGKSVYAAEQVFGPGGREHHRPCLTCLACNKTVTAGGYSEHEGDPFCKHCYAKALGPKGYGHGGTMVGEYREATLGSPSRNSPARGLAASPTKRTSLLQQYKSAADSPLRERVAPSDPACAQTTGTDEDSITASILDDTEDADQSKEERDFHSRFPQLDENEESAPTRTGRTAIETPSSLFDRARYQSHLTQAKGDASDEQKRTITARTDTRYLDTAFAGVRIADDPSTVSIPKTIHNGRPLPVPPVKPSFASKPNISSVATLKAVPLSRPISPASSAGSASTPSFAPAQEGSIESVTMPPAPRIGVGFNSNLGVIGSTGPDMCRRCGTTVYHAEKVIAGGHKWHKRCLRCVTCSKALDSSLCERDNLPYCKKCYDEQFGMRAAGYVLRPGLH